jgi:hypothetical protein
MRETIKNSKGRLMNKQLTREETKKIVSFAMLQIIQGIEQALVDKKEDVTVGKLMYLSAIACQDPDMAAMSMKSVTDSLGLTEIVIDELDREMKDLGGIFNRGGILF